LGAALLARPEQPAVEATGGGSDAPVTSYSR